MLNVLAITAPIYLTIGIGFTATRTGLFSKSEGQVIGRFVLNFALPAMLFNALSQRNFQEVIQPRYVMAYAAGSLLAFAFGFCIARYRRKQGMTQSALVGMGTSCSNSGYIGYPILLQVLGPAAGVGLASTLLVENLLMIPMCLALADSVQSQGAGWKRQVFDSFKRMTKVPMMWAILLGFVFSMLGLHLPEVLSKTVNLFAGACAVLALFVNGGSLVGLRVSGLASQTASIAFGKLVVHPLAVAALLLVVGPMDASLQISAVLLAAMPMLGIYPLLAHRHGQEGFCAAALLVTTLTSFVTISLILWGLKWVPGWHLAGA